MSRFKVVAIVSCLALVAVAFLPGVQADEINKKTTVTFNVPVEVPGVGAQVLPAGTYVFKLVASRSNRHIVRIFNKDETHVYTTILALANYRMRSTGKTVMTFRERPAGEPEAIRTWFYPGDTWGHEFVYPKKRAIELARIVNEPVLATPVELAPTAPIEETLEQVPVVAVTPRGEEVAVAEVVEEAPPVETARLPQTASPLFLLALIGLLSLSAGIALSLARKSKRGKVEVAKA